MIIVKKNYKQLIIHYTRREEEEEGAVEKDSREKGIDAMRFFGSKLPKA